MLMKGCVVLSLKVPGNIGVYAIIFVHLKRFIDEIILLGLSKVIVTTVHITGV